MNVATFTSCSNINEDKRFEEHIYNETLVKHISSLYTIYLFIYCYHKTLGRALCRSRVMQCRTLASTWGASDRAKQSKIKTSFLARSLMRVCVCSLGCDAREKWLNASASTQCNPPNPQDTQEHCTRASMSVVALTLIEIVVWTACYAPWICIWIARRY